MPFSRHWSLFLQKQRGHSSFWRDEWEADQQPAETSSCFSTHPRKRIGHNGVSSSLGSFCSPDKLRKEKKKLPTKSESAILATFYSHSDNKFWKDTGAASAPSTAKLLSRCPVPLFLTCWEKMGLTGLVTLHHPHWGIATAMTTHLEWPIDMRSLRVNFSRGDKRKGKKGSGSVVHWET